MAAEYLIVKKLEWRINNECTPFCDHIPSVDTLVRTSSLGGLILYAETVADETVRLMLTSKQAVAEISKNKILAKS